MLRDNIMDSGCESKGLALLIIDMINDFDFIDGDILFEKSRAIAENILLLRKEAREYNIPVIYVNDNYGQWKSDFNVYVEHCLNDETLGEEIVRMLKPEVQDYFVLKPMHSAFYSTTLELMLEHLRVDSLLLTGVKAESCILATAIDAYMRGFKVFIPKEGVASLNEHKDVVLELLNKEFKAEILEVGKVDFNMLAKN